MTEELKPCPFCNLGPAHVDLIYTSKKSAYVRCGNCGGRGPIAPIENVDWAITAWNTRIESNNLESVSNITLMAESVRRGLATVESNELPEWMKEIISIAIHEVSDPAYYGKFDQGYKYALEWVLSLKKEDK